jgi:alpha-aminoadipic semialdehyde synthase
MNKDKALLFFYKPAGSPIPLFTLKLIFLQHMLARIGIRHEDKYLMERRSPLVPQNIQWLIQKQGIQVHVQSSAKRSFSNQEFKDAGAEIVQDLADCNVIFGVKEMPSEFFERHKTYIFFSHVIKGQKYNMPMLKRMMHMGCNLIDYERIVDESNKRLIFFGRFAGLAGMINTLWTTGLRLKHFGYDSPFLKVKQAHQYGSLREASLAISEVGFEIANYKIPDELKPFTIGVTGYGNVSGGVQEILGLLPCQEILPSELAKLKQRPDKAGNIIYKTTFRKEDLAKHRDSSKAFDLAEFFAQPENYESSFESYLPDLSVLVNGMYWDERYPRIVTRAYLQEAYSKESAPKLTVVGDITCDINGSVEATLKGSYIEDPIYVYDPFTHTINSGHQSDGLQVMAVDILPAELPRDASAAFSYVLMRFVKGIATANYQDPYEQVLLPAAVKKALILHNGELTPPYKYLAKYL